MLKFVSACLSISQFAFANTTIECLPERVDINFKHNGYYHRFHPEGKYVIFTESDRSYILDLTNPDEPKKISTPMREEAYPVESINGGWDLITAPIDGGSKGPKGGLEFFRFQDLVEKGINAQPVYSDPHHGQYYLSAAELPKNKSGQIQIRTLLYSKRFSRDYTLSDTKKAAVQATQSPIRQLCENVFKRVPPIDPKKLKKAEPYLKLYEKLSIQAENATDSKNANTYDKAEEAYHQANIILFGQEYLSLKERIDQLRPLISQLREQLNSLPADSTERIQLTTEVSNLEQELHMHNLNFYKLVEGPSLHNPILSKDGQYVAGLVDETIHVYKIQKNGNCTLEKKTSFRGSKVSFNYPKNGEKPQLVFTNESPNESGYDTQLALLDLQSGESYSVTANEKDERIYYPGFLKDGRIMYSRKDGYTIIAPPHSKIKICDKNTDSHDKSDKGTK